MFGSPALQSPVNVTITGGTLTVNQGTNPWNENIAQFGGSAVTLGQQLASASIPVILPSATITTLTPPAAITNYAQETGGNLDAIETDIDTLVANSPALGQALAAGSVPVVLTAAQLATLTPLATIAATQSGSWTVAISAGSAVIGHVITDSGSVTNATLSAETTKVIGVVRNSDGAGNLLTTNSTTYTAKFALDGNLLGTLGTAFSTAGKVDVKGADGDVFVRQTSAANLLATVSIASAQTLATVTTVGTVTSITNNVNVIGTKTNNNAAPGGTNVGALVGIANAAQQTWTEGDQVLESMNLKGSQRMIIQDAATNDRGVNVTATNQLTVIDTNFPAAGALADTTANPTITQIQDFPMVWDSVNAKWNRVLSANAAHNAASNGLLGVGLLGGGGGSSWFNIGSGNVAADAISPGTGLAVAGTIYTYNGTNWDRVRSISNTLNSIGTGIPTAGLVAQFDDVSPGTITENQFGPVRMSVRREIYDQIRDAAGNERGVNVTANNELQVLPTKKDTYGTTTTFTITLASLANSTAGVGRQSTLITSNTAISALIAVKFTVGTTPVANSLIFVYLIRGDGTLTDDNAGASDAGITIINAPLLGTILCSAATSNATYYGVFDTKFLGSLGKSFGIAIVNSTNVTANATGGNFSAEYTLIT